MREKFTFNKITGITEFTDDNGRMWFTRIRPICRLVEVQIALARFIGIECISPKAASEFVHEMTEFEIPRMTQSRFQFRKKSRAQLIEICFPAANVKTFLEFIVEANFCETLENVFNPKPKELKLGEQPGDPDGEYAIFIAQMIDTYGWTFTDVINMTVPQIHALNYAIGKNAEREKMTTGRKKFFNDFMNQFGGDGVKRI